MSLFKQLRPFTREQAILAADTLAAGNVVAVRVDPRPAYVVFLSSAPRGLPYEVDFVCTGEDMSVRQGPPPLLAMTRQQRARLLAWAEPAVKLICTVWQERHPVS